MFDIGRRFFYSKIINKLITKKPRWHGRVVALLMSALFVVQMLVPLPWGAAGNQHVPPDENELWMHPRIELNGKNIYDGISIPLSAMMNAVYEFTINTSQFPIEVSLPDVLEAVTGEYTAVAFDVYGELLSGVKIFVDKNGVIEVHYELVTTNVEDNENTDGVTDADGESEQDGCCESCADDIGSNEPDEADYGDEAGGNFADSSGDATGNDENSEENPFYETPGNATSGSNEPVNNNSTDEDNNAECTVTTGSSGSPVTDLNSPGDYGSGAATTDEDGIRSSESGDSASMFSNAGAPTASAFYGEADEEEIIIIFEIPCYFNIDKLPPMPMPVFNEETEEWIEPEPWLVDVFHTELIDEKHVGEFVTVEILPGEFELSFAAFDDDIVLLDDDAEFYAIDSCLFIGIIDWNDNGWTSPWDAAGRRPASADFKITLYFEIEGRRSEPLTAEHLVAWGWVKVIPDGMTQEDFDEAYNKALEEAQKLIDTPVPTFSGLRSNFWTYTYTGLPTSLREIIDYDHDTDPATPEFAPEPIGITYSFKMNDTSFEEDYIISELSTNVGTGFVNTRREVFTFTKEWKDANNKYLTRVSWEDLSEHLNFSRLFGDDTEQELGTLAKLDRDIIPDVTITPPSGTDTGRWTITITDIPMFDSDGTQFHYFVDESAGLSIANGHTVPTPNNNVRYEASYENVGASAEDITRCFNRGVIVNRLTDEVEFNAWKRWQDDGSVGTRPAGRLQLQRYPNIPGMSYRTASPVSGMEINLQPNDFNTINAFKALPAYDELYPNGFPRFDSEGNEYVYFVKELIPAPGFYRGIAEYSDSNPFYVPADRGAGNLYNGGTLYNRRVGSAGVSVTKRWNAAARQSMNASITVLVERNLPANPPHRPEESGWERVNLTGVGGSANGEFELTGFRAEIMELTHSFAGLPRFDNEGREYNYRISEIAVTIDGDRVTDLSVPPGQQNPVITFDDGYVYRMGKEIADGGQNDEGTPIANTFITNTLIGESEVRIRKTWNGVHPNTDYPQGTVRFVVTRADGGAINWIDPNLKISMDNGGTVTDRPTSTTNYAATTSQLFIELPHAGQGGVAVNNWLVLSGLPRYDERGREITYVVREVATPGYHNSFSYKFYDRENPRVGVTEAEFTNTPAGESGRYLTVYKEWADDGDLACRGNVVMGLFHVSDPNNHISTATLARGNDWMAFMRLSKVIDRVPILNTDGEPSGEYRDIEDHNYNNYFVKELYVIRSGNRYVMYNPGAFPYQDLTSEAWRNQPRLGTLTTDAHHYDVFGRAGFSTGTALNDNLKIDYYTGTTLYRTSYTFRNVRTGEVEIDIRKNWTDAMHHQRVPQQVQIEIHRRLNYPNAQGEYEWIRLNEHKLYDGTLITDDDAFDGVILLQWDESKGVASLRWSSDNRSGFPGPAGLTLPKYSPDGVLYVYRVTETYVHEMDAAGNRIAGRSHRVSGGSYVLADGHQYAASVERTATYYGDHRPGQTSPEKDRYSYTVTNRRSETINFAVYKLWHDVARVAPFGGVARAPGVTDFDFDPQMEAHRRPDVFLTLYQSIGGNAPVEVPQFIGREWSTTGIYNEYFWKCTFNPLPRYTASGEEIFYSVVEGMPTRAGGDYVTEYWELIVPEIVPNPWIRPSPVPVDLLLDRVTDRKVHDVPNRRDPAAPAPGDEFVLTGTVTAEGQPGRVGNGGIIVNRREASRYMSGYKVWKNVPTDTPPTGFPTIELALMQRDDNSTPIWRPVDTGRFPNVVLTNGNTAFSFGGGTVAMARYDRFGVYIRYRAEEVSRTPDGYKDPVYNDYLMEVTNEYDVSTEASTVTVSFTKTWNYAPFTEEEISDLNPAATIELWRVMTRGGTATGDEFWRGNGTNTSAIGGRDIAGTEIKVGEITISYNQSGEHVFRVDNLGFDLPEDEEDLKKLGKLLRIGYNGQPYRYFLRESLDGYTFDPGIPEYTLNEDTTNIPRTPTTAEFHYELATNRYDGFSSDINANNSLIRLSGTKDWVDSTNLFGTRPNGVEPYLSPGGQPSVTLRVFRAVAGSTPGTIRPNTFEEITGSVDIVWTKTAGNDNRWNYVINAKPTLEPGMLPVGVAPGGPGTGSGTTLYRFSLTGDEFVYFVEEVGVNHHYHAPERTGGAAIPTAMTGSTFVPPTVAGNLRLMASGGTDKITGFRNTLRTTTVPVTKIWQRQDAADSTVAMSLENPSELELMIPPGITFRLQFREMIGDSVVRGWSDFNHPVTGNPYLVERTRQEIINALRASGTNTMALTFNNPLLPQFGATPNIHREYRLVETHIGTAAVTAGSAGGFTVTGNDGGPVTNTLTTVPLTIRKVWDDDNNRDGTRPLSITFRITRDGNPLQIMDVVMTPTADTAQRTFYVPQFRADGVTPSTYTVEELIGDAASRAEYTLQGATPEGSFVINAPNVPPLDGSMVYQFTNQNNQRRISLTVAKTWSDAGIDTSIGAGQRSSIRPVNNWIYVTIQRSSDGINWANMEESQLEGTQVPTVRLEVSNTSPWTQTHAWTGLTARHSQGEYFRYRVIETDSNGNVTDSDGEKTTIHAYTATYRIGSTGTFVTNPVSVTEYNTVSNVARIELENRLDTVRLDVEKAWASGIIGNQFAPTAPVDVELLYRLAGQTEWIVTGVTRQLTGTTSPAWTGNFANLPKENNEGVAYQYTVREVAIGVAPNRVNFITGRSPYSFSTSVTDPAGNPPSVAPYAKSTVTNTLVTRSSITVNKIWVDNNNQDGRRPDTVEVRLIRDMGTAEQIISAPVLLRLTGGSTGNNWTHTWSNLPMYMRDGVTPSTYHVAETSVLHYQPAEFAMNAGLGTPVAGTAGSGTLLNTRISSEVGDATIVDITNRYTPQVMNITATKAWSDQSNIYSTQPAGVRLQLFVTDGTDTPTAVTGIPNPVTVNAATAWNTGSAWSNLPLMRNTGGISEQATAAPGISRQLIYTVVELPAVGEGPITGYLTPTVVYTGGSSTVAGIRGNIATPSVAHEAVVTNRLDVLGSITVNKVWSDLTGILSDTNINEFARTATVDVELNYRLAGETDWIPTGVTRQLTLLNNWTSTFTNLPRQNNSGTAFEYTVREVKIGGVAFDTGVFPLSYRSEANTVNALSDPAGGITVTNMLQTRSSITVNKIWEDGNNQDGRRPVSDSVTVYLIRDIGVTGQEMISAPVTLSLTNDWSHTFENLPRFRQDGVTLSTYHVAEVSIPHYSVDFVMGDGSSVQVTDESGDFPGKWVSGAVDTNTIVNITNKYTPQEMTITATKVWSDRDNYQNPRPDSVRLQLMVTDSSGITKPAEMVGMENPVTVSAGTSWNAQWSGLPIMYNTGGLSDQKTAARGVSSQLVYTVIELPSVGAAGPIPGYHAPTIIYSVGSSTAADIRGNITNPTASHEAVVTNTLATLSSITVNKVWRDSTGILSDTNINEFARTASVDVRLYYRLAGPGDASWTPRETLQLNSENQWTGTFTYLPRQNGYGVDFEYTVREVKIGGITFDSGVFPLSYESDAGTPVNAMTGPVYGIAVTNTLVTRNDITVTKDWDDRNNQDGIRPSSVVVHLIKDMGTAGEIISNPVTLSAPSWSHTFTNLPRYNATGDESTYHVMEVPLSAASGYSLIGYQVGSATGFTFIPGTGTGAAAGRRVSARVDNLADTAPATVVTVQNNYVPKVMGLTATKLWEDASNRYDVRPATIRLQLRVTTDPTDPNGWENIGSSVLVSASSSPAWTHTWSNLPIMRNIPETADTPDTSVHLFYSVVELSAGGVLPVYGYTARYLYRPATSSQGVVSESGNSIRGSINDAVNTIHFAEVTNAINTTNITVNKVWDDLVTSGANPYARRGEVVVRLYYRSGNTGDFSVAPESTTGGNTRTLIPQNNWSEVFQNLPRRNASGVNYQYTVREVSIGGVSFSYDASAPVFPLSYRSESDVTIANDGPGMPTAPITVTNTMQVRNNFTISKIWDDNNNFDGIRPGSVQVRLIRDMGVPGQEMISQPVTLSAANNWSHTFTNLPKFRENGVTPSTYHLYEIAVTGYVAAEYRIGTNGIFTEFSTGVPYTGPSTLLPSGARVTGEIPDAASVTVNMRNTHVPRVDVVVTKQWIDYENIHELRPESLEFTLQRRIGASAFDGVPGTESVTVVKSVEDGTSQSHVFRNLPRFDPSGVPYDYRVLETAATGGLIHTLAAAPGNPTRGVIGADGEDGTHYSFTSSTSLTPGSTGRFETTVTNELVVEKIRIFGSKTWDDNFNRFGIRPDTLQLRVWYYDNDTGWEIVPPDGYTVNWTIPSETSPASNIWTYEIHGHELIKYDPVTQLWRVYAVQEVLPSQLQAFYGVTVDNPTDVHTPAPENSSVGQRVNTVYRNGYIINANFTNSLKTDETTSLWVHKDTDFGPKAPNERAPVFSFRVYFSMNRLTDPAQGTLLRDHDYHVLIGKYADDESVLSTLDSKRIASDGKIVIAAGESFILQNLPQGLFFYIVEDEHLEFELKEGSVMHGQLGRASIVNLSTDPMADPIADLILAPTVFEVENEAVRLVSILNTTPNEGVQANGNGQTPTRRTNAGGTVTVEDGSQMYTEADGVEGVRDALAVRWEPEGFWTVGGQFTIRYTDFGETDERSITVHDYLNPDGSAKSLHELLGSTDNPAGLQRFIDAQARLEITSSGAVRLVLSHTTDDMPRTVTVEVRFLPTLAVNNVTVDEAGSKIGGNVMVIGRDGFDDSNLRICSDGVPAFGGKPYVSQSVYGIPIEGFTTDWSHIAVRNLNELDCVYVLLEPCEDGYFTAQLSTTIAGVDEIVEKSGRITRGSVLIEFDGLPVPLQVDLRFIPLDSVADDPVTDDPVTDDPNVQGGNGGLPQTGVMSMLWVLVIGLTASLVATAAVLIVIRRQSLKDKR